MSLVELAPLVENGPPAKIRGDRKDNAPSKVSM
jgi:hypothetical protein